jgi:hypothetical protein
MLQPKKRPDTPLAPTPEPVNVVKGKILKSENKPVNVVKGKILKSENNNGGYAEGVVISKKDEKAHPEDFKYLKRK